MPKFRPRYRSYLGNWYDLPQMHSVEKIGGNGQVYNMPSSKNPGYVPDESRENEPWLEEALQKLGNLLTNLNLRSHHGKNLDDRMKFFHK